MKRDYTSIRLEITSKCNLNCTYCHNSDYNNLKNDMTSDELIKLITNMKTNYNINKILLTGGEPLIKYDIYRIIKEITSLGIKVDMVTNGTLLTEKSIKKLEEAGLKRIRISIDEIGENTNVRDNISPSLLWEKAQMVKKYSNIQLAIHTVCSPHNVKQLFDVYKKVLEIGAARWRVFDMGYQGGFINNYSYFKFDNYYNNLINSTKMILDDYLKNNVKKILDIEINNVFKTSFLKMKKNVEFDLQKALEDRRKLSPCNYVTNHQITIRSDGSGTLCQYFRDPIYNYQKYNFDINEVLKNDNKPIENELTMDDINHCKNCKYCLVCNSGCRSRAKFLTGNITDADPSACYLHPMVHKEIMTMLPKEILNIYESYINPNGLNPKYKEEDLRKLLDEKGYEYSV